MCQDDGQSDAGGPDGIDPQAHWMWYASSTNVDAFHFSTLAATRPFLIFRLAAQSLPPPN